MKSKRTARLISCIVLTLIIVLSMASCDNIGGAFDNLADGNFKGAWGSLVGKHEYAPTVTPPTCTERGYTTYTCGKCGHTYVDDYVDPAHTLVSYERKEPTCKEEGYEAYQHCTKCDYSTYRAIPVVAHEYVEKVTRFPTTLTEGVKSTMCLGCGIHTDEPINAVTFNLPEVSNFLKSFVGNNSIVISAKDSEIILIKEIVTEDMTTYETTTAHEKNYVAIELGYFELDGERDELYALLNLNVGIASYDSLDEDAVPTFTRQLDIDVIVNGEDVSVSVVDDGVESHDGVRLSEMFYRTLASMIGIDYYELVELVYVGGIAEAFVPFIQSIADVIASVKIPEGSLDLASILSIVVDVDTFDGGKIYSLDFTAIANAVKELDGKTVATLIDARFGEGTTLKMEGFILSLPNLKVRDIADLAVAVSDKYDVPVDEIYAIINYVVHISTGEDFNIESEIIARYDMTVVDIMSLITGQDKTEIASGLMMTLTQLTNVIKTYDVDQLFNLMSYGDPEYSLDGSGVAYSITAALSEAILYLNDGVRADVVVLDDGTLQSVDLYLDGLFTVSVGSDDDGYTDAYVQFALDGEYYTFILDAGAYSSTFKFSFDDKDMIVAEFNKNEFGEIVDATVIVNQVVRIGTTVPDSTGEGYVEVYEERVEKALEITYGYDGEGNYVLRLDAVYAKYEITVTETVTEELRVLNGVIDFKNYEGDTVMSANEGSFTYEEKLDGSGSEFTLSVDFITYDYTIILTEGECYEYVYDFENPKRYNVLDVSFINSGDGNLTLVVDANAVEHYNGVSDVKNQDDISLTVTTGDESIVYDLIYNGQQFKVTVSYVVSEIVVAVDGESTEGSVVTEEIIYVTEIVGIRVEQLVEDERILLIEAAVTETENGKKLAVTIEGFKYEKVEVLYRYLDSGNAGADENYPEEDWTE